MMSSSTLSLTSEVDVVDGGGFVSTTSRPLYSPERDPVPIVKESGWAPGPIWMCAENLAPTGIRSRAVHPVAIRYTEYASPAHKHSETET
jgi:hypothetical protein